jgi:transposase-like protein
MEVPTMEPPFCPNPRCVHHNDSPQEYRPYWRKFGYHDTLVVGPVQRFRCKACGKTYSTRTFSIQFYTKRIIDLKEIHRSLTQGECLSAIARHLGCTLESVQNRIDRLGRASIAAQARILEASAPASIWWPMALRASIALNTIPATTTSSSERARNSFMGQHMLLYGGKAA